MMSPVVRTLWRSLSAGTANVKAWVMLHSQQVVYEYEPNHAHLISPVLPGMSKLRNDDGYGRMTHAATGCDGATTRLGCSVPGAGSHCYYLSSG
jgi:hypothetical protein